MSTSDPTASPSTFDLERRVDSADTTLHGQRCAVIALGSNLGNRLDTLQGAVDALADTPGLRIKAVSAVYETEAVGGPDEQPNYYNAVVVLRTSLPPHDLLERGNAIEDAFGRVRTVRWGPRTLDVDILAYEGVTSDDPQLLLPHPRSHERAFVLAPWLDAQPEAELPGHGRVGALLDALGGADAQGVRRRDDIRLTLPE
ncbi:2-amino-4-hydroxy-6-hydroxymethyldihydropteridine diphosphokinase [Kitasatospora sp. CM 4170]|uniref:2-amino-4-hydroxy-6-hydroxymethyldihydropteridine diphosphokinase n=1 Tax=Kitasatospora aburaviensis TaxID=67265 RepID=A0ABW1FA61_9ACTN|nr:MULTISPECIES: 2-amino-4-hydroxy-6-hydroxymethyldihydropteridine diphosphokinase [unclassified Kitasatospora]MCG6495032.1 2-amino-4-hydroxy-6-hydroxymethyldihydropteridine diphosphokinase [Kitasatospora sp. A2-31]WNM47196.1 2-amino-4-hydroxy-6-hydroxymethyldihydropteridine diphosphokinase [Kitasatospora sp. CM 4170]